MRLPGKSTSPSLPVFDANEPAPIEELVEEDSAGIDAPIYRDEPETPTRAPVKPDAGDGES